MFANFVEKVTFTCPQCNTSITFDIPWDDIRKLFNVTERLTCPKCLESLSSDARHGSCYLRVQQGSTGT